MASGSWCAGKKHIQKEMKTLVRFFLIIISLALVAAMFSCSTEKKLHRAINKHGQKQSVAYIVANYPEYFRQSEPQTVRDTVRDTLEIIRPEVSLDSTFAHLADSLILENDKLRVALIKTANGWNLSGTAKADTVYYPVEYPVEIPCPTIICPDIDKIVYTGNKWFIWLIAFMVGVLSTLSVILLSRGKWP
jgi:hypothetical protein